MTRNTLPHFRFDNYFAGTMEGFYVPWKAAIVPKPEMMQFNEALAKELGFDATEADPVDLAMMFSGNLAPDGATPLAQVYAGHQFGGFSPQLGDGRALLLGEVIDTQGKRQDIQLKGSGPTPFSRNGDGKAAVGPVLREYLLGEAMHVLDVPTTRALAAVSTGEEVRREIALPGAVLTRVAASHIRVGTFEFFAARGEMDQVQQLADYVIQRHYPDLREADNPYLAMFQAIVKAQARLVARWMQLGFIHGVMNTDNVTVSGETIDYGPCAFMEAYAPDTVFSSIDVQGRYAYGNQPQIAQWNLARLAETLIEAVHPDKEEAKRLLTDAVNGFPEIYLAYWLDGMRTKIGLVTREADDLKLVNTLLLAMEGQNADFTLVFRRLSDAALGQEADLRALFDNPDKLNEWLGRWHDRMARESTTPEERAQMMNRTNPLYIPRNHKVEEALEAAVKHKNLAPFKTLLKVLKTPYDEAKGQKPYATPSPTGSPHYKTFCGT